MAKIKLHGRTKYPFKWLNKVGDKFKVTEPKNTVNAAYHAYKKKSPGFEVSIEEFENGLICVTRTK